VLILSTYFENNIIMITTHDVHNGCAIFVENLHKSFDGFHALQGVSLKISTGEFYALMGPNGSGKTTLTSIIAGTTRPDTGTVRVFEHDIQSDGLKAKCLIGYVPQENFSAPHLTGKENLEYFARLLGYSKSQANQKAVHLLEMMNLTEHANKRVSGYSGGMRKRLEVATALLPDIQVLILDEPTTGLDPSARKDFLESLSAINKDGITILFVTHIGEDAEAASIVGFMNHGKIIIEDSPDLLKRRAGLETSIIIDIDHKCNELTIALASLHPNCIVLEIPTGYRMCCEDTNNMVSKIVRLLDEMGFRATRVELDSPTLEDAYFKWTRLDSEEGAL
jgi:ABC-2 type transport system ATP-binding protein